MQRPSGMSLTGGGSGGEWWRRACALQARRALRRLRARGAAPPGRGLLLGGCGGLAASGVLASAHMSGAPQEPHRPPRPRGFLDFGSPVRRCTDTLLVANALAFAGQWLSRDALTLWGAKVNSLVAAGQWWRLLTSSLLHTSLFHLAINSHALHTIGPHLEAVSGRGRFVAVYTAGAVAGTAASVLFTPAPSVGASAALFGVGAALGVFYWRHKGLLGERSDHVLRQLGITLALNAAYSLANRRVDNWGHLGGMLGGAALAAVLGPRLVRDTATGRLVDSPPWPLFAHQGAAAALGARGSGGGEDKGRGRGGARGKKLPRRPDGGTGGDARP
ncbi:MAG: hypothetical protein J3K34DRAFT_412041 [Monoraphidium minutum]|nr:MAG: hypothetical protein J3K34DRAFT_412041 [Monoraphidium minutum]